MKLDLDANLVIVGAGAIALLVAGLYVAKKGIVGAAAAATGVVADAASGVVLGIGDVLGVPRTDADECERAIRDGRTLDASFACPASKWLGALVTARPGGQPPTPSNDSTDPYGLPPYFAP